MNDDMQKTWFNMNTAPAVLKAISDAVPGAKMSPSDRGDMRIFDAYGVYILTITREDVKDLNIAVPDLSKKEV